MHSSVSLFAQPTNHILDGLSPINSRRKKYVNPLVLPGFLQKLVIKRDLIFT